MLLRPARQGRRGRRRLPVGIANRLLEGGRADLIIVDTQHMEDGPIAKVHLPFRSYSQVHGWWVSADDLPKT